MKSKSIVFTKSEEYISRLCYILDNSYNISAYFNSLTFPLGFDINSKLIYLINKFLEKDNTNIHIILESENLKFSNDISDKLKEFRYKVKIEYLPEDYTFKKVLDSFIISEPVVILSERDFHVISESLRPTLIQGFNKLTKIIRKNGMSYLDI